MEISLDNALTFAAPSPAPYAVAAAAPKGSFIEAGAPYICPSGYYCPDESSLKECPEGFYCPMGALAPYSCPASFYCPAKSASAPATTTATPRAPALPSVLTTALARTAPLARSSASLAASQASRPALVRRCWPRCCSVADHLLTLSLTPLASRSCRLCIPDHLLCSVQHLVEQTTQQADGEWSRLG